MTIQDVVIPEFPESLRQERIQTILLENGGLEELIRRGVPICILRIGGVDTISCAMRLLQAGIPGEAFQEGYEFSVLEVPRELIKPLLRNRILMRVTAPTQKGGSFMDIQAMIPFEVVFE